MISAQSPNNNANGHRQGSMLVTLFQRHLTCPDKPMVHSEDQSISYVELDQRSDKVASFLSTHALLEQSLVCILLPRSIDAILAKLGILKAGGAYLPLSPEDFPQDRLETIFDDAQVTFVITTSKYLPVCEVLQERLDRPLVCYLLDKEDDTHYLETTNLKVEGCNAQTTITHTDEKLAYVMYTSGSTGKPKGVMITQQNIIQSVTDTDYFSLGEEDAFLHAAPISFDAATFEVWAALLNGKDLYIVSEKTVHQFDAFTEFVNTRPVTIAWLTSALFNLLADTRLAFFKPFKQILVGGEALSARHINQVRHHYPSLILRNNYGPTENTIFSTSFLIDQDYADSIPIGRPIRHKRAYILNKLSQPVAAGTEGELFVAGCGVSPGYLNLDSETKARFLPDPFHPGEQMYATGDLCKWNDAGEILFIGRQDKQVKISGHRIELGEIESALQACSQVKRAVVLYKEINASVKGLVAYLVGDGVDLSRLKLQLKEKLPAYMIPLHIDIRQTLPLTLNGKIDRLVMQSWPIQIAQTEQSVDESIKQLVEDAWIQVLDIESVEPSARFFDLGGDSLLGTTLMIKLEQQLGVSMPLQLLYEHPCMDDFIKAIEDIMSHGVHKQQNKRSLADDAKLDDSIRLRGRRIHCCRDLKAPEANLFLTGATGFFGAFLLKELLETTKGHIYCLVRARDEHHAIQRLLKVFSDYKIQVSAKQIERLRGIAGDLCKPRLGLSTEQYHFITSNMDVIFHNGASVNYVDTYETLKGPNVNGSQEVLTLSCHDRVIPVHYISSVSVFETVGFFTGRQFIYETDNVDASEDYVRLGYSQSKWVAEKMMQNAREAGLPVSIYRSGYIMGHSKTGVSNTTDHIARYIAGCIEMGCAPILNEYASLAPVDQLSSALCHIALKGRTQGKTFHLCNPNFVTVDEIYQKIRSAGFQLELVSYSIWKDRLKRVPTNNPLYPLLSLHIHPAPDHTLTLPELYEHNTRFDCTHLLSELADADIRISLQSPYLFERWLQDYINKGLISMETYQQDRMLECIA